MATYLLERLPTNSHAPSPSLSPQATRRRVYIFLNRYGFIYSITLFVMLIGAINYNNSLAYALVFLLSGLFLVTMLHTYGNMRGLIIKTAAAEPVFAGQIARFPLTINNGSASTRIALKIQAMCLTKKKFRRLSVPGKFLTIANVNEHALKNSFLKVEADKRGYLTNERIKISTTWPLGLFQAWSYINDVEKSIVYPRPLGTKQMPQINHLGNEQQTGKSAGSEDFAGFRDYQAGDSLRAVDWKVYARQGDLVIKRFSGQGSQKILINWADTLHLNDAEARLSQLSLWIVSAERDGLIYGLSLPGSEMTAFSNGPGHRHHCLRLLALFEPDNEAA